MSRCVVSTIHACSQGNGKMMFSNFQAHQLESWFESNDDVDQSRAELFAFVLNIQDPIRVKMWFRNKQLLEDLKNKTVEDSEVPKSDKSGLKRKRDAARQEKRQVRHDHCDFLPNCLSSYSAVIERPYGWYFLYIMSNKLFPALADEFTIVWNAPSCANAPFEMFGDRERERYGRSQSQMIVAWTKVLIRWAINLMNLIPNFMSSYSAVLIEY